MSTFHNILTPDDDLQAVLDHSSPGDFIQLSEGDFRLKCTVFVPSLTIRGADMDKTRIIWDDYANKIHEDGKEYNTFRTWTMAVCADHITMEKLEYFAASPLAFAAADGAQLTASAVTRYDLGQM